MSIRRYRILVLLLMLSIAPTAQYKKSFAQSGTHEPPENKNGVKPSAPKGHSGSGNQGMQNMPGMTQGSMQHPGMNSAGKFLSNESSGTAFQPSAWPMPMLMTTVGKWHLNWMGQAFVADTQQSGPRGADKLYSTNWGMLSAIHKLGEGSVALRSMISLEPATITNRRYPLLFQTGETAYGIPLVDAQHPHDLIMELSVQYARSFSQKGIWNIYYAPVGDPALGPVAYPHRASAMELPQASLGHHWQDSTHIANNVLTGGVSYGKLRWEASGFFGREPNENRWNIDWGAMDSWASRLSVFPTNNWVAQFSVGRLQDPEASHAGSVVRTTASIEYVRPANGGNYRAASFIWGQNYKIEESRRTNSVLAETVVPLLRRNFVTGRFEWSQRDELFQDNPQLSEQIMRLTGREVFNVSAFTIGYTRDVALWTTVQTGIGSNVSIYAIPDVLKSFYGDQPWGVNFFLRVRIRPETH